MKLKDTSFLGRLARLFGDRRGAVSPLFALLLIPLIGGFGLAVETSTWYYMQRSMQNAADTAVMAAATNGGATYDAEAKAAATKYGFTGGVSNTTVTPAQNQTCPTVALGNTCYKVTITKIMPIAMARITGFTGSTALGGGRGQTVTAVALANQRSNAGFCAMALSTDSKAFGGKPNAGIDFGGCNVFSNGSFFCPSGTDFKITSEASVDAPNGSHACTTDGVTASAIKVIDPYAGLSIAANIPTAIPPGCANGGTIAGDVTLAADGCYKGTITINGTVNVKTNGADRVIRIYNGGGIVLNAGAKLVGPTDAGLTVVFTGASTSPPGFVTGDATGTITLSAPTTGTWAGMAIYQDQRMTASNQTITQTINATGLIYLPKVSLNFYGKDNYTGAIKCAAIMAFTINVDNHAGFSVDTTKDCLQAGLTLPKSAVLQSRQALVQ